MYRSNFTEHGSDESDEEDETTNSLETKDQMGNYMDFNTKTNLNISSYYILTSQFNYKGKVWPRSQFEKIDVLLCCLNNGNREFQQAVKETQDKFERESKLLPFPIEVIIEILEILYQNGHLRTKFLRLSKLFYAMVLPMIYRSPKLKATNFFSFVESVSTNKKLGENIRQLDLSYIIQTGKNAYVAKLLKRSKKRLEIFVAPQTSFGFGPLLALKNCTNLRVLDLRLVSETINLEELFQSIRTLDKLTHLSFPRSSIETDNCSAISWPPNLSFLRVSGGISDDFLCQSSFPATIKQLEFSHCPAVKHDGFQSMLMKLGGNLTSLKVQYPMPGLHSNSLDSVFHYCPYLVYLEVAVDYTSNMFFDEEKLPDLEFHRPLRSLFVDSSGMLGTSDRLDPIDLAIALNDNRLPCLKNLSCTAKLGWDPKSEYVSYVASVMDERGGGLYIGY